jgi:hypothetical protein
MHTESLSGNLKGRDHLENLGVDGSLKLRRVEITYEVVEFIYLAQNRGQFRAFVNTVMSFRVL